MKSSELRLTNYIQDSDGIVFQVLETSIFELDLDENKWKPIPLTEDWLIKFGFDIEWTNGGFLKWQKGEFKVLDRRLPHPQYHKPEAILLYVHQLQNLYFALTGEELTIK